MYTFGQLKADVRAVAFPDGEAANLVSVHNKIMAEAMVMIQEWVEQYQVNNTQIYPFCSTFFQCGFTVLQAPRGIIRRLRTYARLNENCVGEDSEPVNYCSEILYSQVSFPALKQHLDRRLRCACNGANGFAGWDWFSVQPWTYCQKTLQSAYPAPTDADYVGFPELPLGFHYPQDSTDLRFRAQVGVWALENGRIYIAPWINSSEVVVIDWDGKKRDWVDDDIVDEEADALLQQAVKHYLLMCHYRDYEKDPAQYELHKLELYGNLRIGVIGALPTLQHRLREETRARARSETGSTALGAHNTLQAQASGTIT